MVAAAFALTACGGPVGPFAGGELDGVAAPPPAQWRKVPETIALEVRPAEPYSVNVWSVGIGARLYVAHGPDGSTWGSHLRADSRVRVRVAGTVYALEAVVVEAAQEREQVVDAYLRKYGGEEDDSGFAPIRARRQQAMREALDDVGGTIYRLQPRPRESAAAAPPPPPAAVIALPKSYRAARPKAVLLPRRAIASNSAAK